MSGTFQCQLDMHYGCWWPLLRREQLFIPLVGRSSRITFISPYLVKRISHRFCAVLCPSQIHALLYDHVPAYRERCCVDKASLDPPSREVSRTWRQALADQGRARTIPSPPVTCTGTKNPCFIWLLFVLRLTNSRRRGAHTRPL